MERTEKDVLADIGTISIQQEQLGNQARTLQQRLGQLYQELNDLRRKPKEEVKVE